MRPFILFILLLGASIGSNAQTSVSGTVNDSKNNPLPLASISIRDSYDGTTADSLGRFRFSSTEKGSRVLIISALGYKTFETAVELGGKEISVQAVMKEEFNELKAVVITAGSFEASDKKRATVLNSIDIVTTASANADITGAIKTLPGAQQVGESEGLFVRGGTASETKTFIDGTLVNNFFYSSVPNIAQRGRFTPFIFKGTVFSAGGYSALYGQALSSALILESIDLPERSSASLGISPISVSGGFQKLTNNKKASWGVNYGYTFLDLAFNVIRQRVDYFKMPRFHTADANFRIKTSSSGMLKYYGYLSQNAVGLRQNSIDTPGYKDAFKLANINIYHNLSYRQNLGTYWKMQSGISYSNNKDEIRGRMQNSNNEDVLIDQDTLRQKNFDLDSRGNYFNAKLVLDRRLSGLSAIRFGSEWNYSDDRFDYTLYNGSLIPGAVKESIISGFGESDIYLTNDLAARVGVRAEYSTLLGKWNLSPRASIAQKMGQGGQLSFAYGIFYQSPERRYLPALRSLDFSKATHYIVQYQKITQLTTFRMEAFYKNYDNLLKTSGAQGPALSNGGYGYARGFELFWRDKKSIRNFDYWVSYSFLDTKRDFLNYPGQIEPNFAAKHTANLVVKKFVTGLRTQFNANYAYATGRPYYNIRYNNAEAKFNILDQGRTMDFHSLSISVNYLPNLFKKGAGASRNTVFVLSVTNVLGSTQVFGYNYSYNNLRKEAIMPPAKTFVFIGAFISFGVDRTQDIINSNL